MSEILHPRNIAYRYEIPPKETAVAGAVVLRLRDGAQIIGEPEAAEQVAFAHKLLENMMIHHPRQMSVVIAPSFVLEADAAEEHKPWIAEDVLRRFGILEQLRGSDYNPFDPNVVGVRCDVRQPVHVTYDHAKWQESPQDFPLFLAFTYAAELMHEWAHVKQEREGLPSYSLWSERHAMSEQTRLLYRILNRFSRLKKESVQLLQIHGTYYLQAIHDYVNGRGFSDHLLEDYMQGSPLKDQTLYRD